MFKKDHTINCNIFDDTTDFEVFNMKTFDFSLALMQIKTNYETKVKSVLHGGQS